MSAFRGCYICSVKKVFTINLIILCVCMCVCVSVCVLLCGVGGKGGL